MGQPVGPDCYRQTIHFRERSLAEFEREQANHLSGFRGSPPY